MNTKILDSKFTARQVSVYNDICWWNPDMYGTDTNCEGARDYYNSISSCTPSGELTLSR